jgi:membrane fusion protein, heavy metal efflux system
MNKGIFAVFLGALLFCTACQKKPEVVTNTQPDDLIQINDETAKSIGLKVQEAKVQTANFELRVNGVVKSDPNKTFSISSPVAGKVMNVSVNPNTLVSQNQSLATVVSQDVAQLEFDLMGNDIELRGQIEQAQLELSLAKSDLDREAKLFRQGISAQKDLLEAENKYKRAQKNLAVLQEKRKLTKDLSKKRLGIVGAQDSGRQGSGMVNVISPRSGMILKRSANPGELVDTTDILFQVSDLSEVLLEAQIYEKDLPNISIGEKITFVSEACPKESFTCTSADSFDGRISYIAPTVDPETRTINVRARMANTNYKLKPEMFGEMLISLGENEALIVSKDALQQVDGNDVVYIKTAKGFREKPVKVGKRSKEYIEILSGLKPGSQVVAKGSFWLKSELHGEQ